MSFQSLLSVALSIRNHSSYIVTALVCSFTLAACDSASDEDQATATSASSDVPTTASASASANTAPADVDFERLLNADADTDNWLSYSRTYDEQRFSPLTQINDSNISELGLAWYVDLPTNQNVESTPLMIDGILYLSLPWSELMAIDARTGETLWHYDPQVPGEWNANICCGLDNRGVAAWEGKLILGTLDGRLIAVDAATGEEIWSVKSTPDEGSYGITGAPRVADGKIFIGSSGGEFAVRGYIAAHDVDTGELLWRFWTVPGNPADGFENEAMEMAAETWIEDGWWEKGPGGTVWDAITYDPSTNLVIFGTGNGSPWDAVDRDSGGGDNLFISSIVAVNADDGSYVWHYQQGPWETWDYDVGQQLVLVDIELDGEIRHTVMQASKNGFFYVWDANTGELLRANNYTDVNWATGINMEDGRPFENPDARYNLTGEAFTLYPGPAGGHAWQPVSYSPETGLMYIPATSHRYTVGEFDARQQHLEENPESAGELFTGRLTAWDPVTMQEVWRSEEFVNPRGGIQVTGGALATAGNLVFHGNNPNKEFAAYRATDGERLWVTDAKTSVFTGAISYAVDGEQYIAVAVGGPVEGGYYAPNGARLLVYKLGGTETLPDLPEFTQRPFSTAEQFADMAAIQRGTEAFEANCATCHGQGGAARSTFPDLRRSPMLADQGSFDAVVLDGFLSQNGMGSFADRLEDGDTEAIRAYLISQAQQALAQQ